MYDYLYEEEGQDTSNFPSPAFDREAIEKHFNLLHERAVGIDGLIPVVAITDGDIKVHQFPVGDPKRSTEIIMSYEGVSNCNIYAAWAVMRPDLRPDERGKETDVIAVLAAAGDLDTDKGESVPLENLPIKPSIVVESSEGNFQPVYIFEKPLPQEKAKPILTALSQIVGGDAGQDVASHLWRVPGTLNWPTKSKLKRGRSPIAQSVRLKEQFRGVLVKSDDLNLSAPESKTVAFEKVQPPRTVRQEKPQNKSLSFEEQFKLQNDLEQWRPASECSYDEWLRVGMACHNANCRFIWDIWSRGSIKFDAAKQEKSWKSFSEEGSSGDPVTMGSIYSWIALVKKAEFHKKHKGCGDFIDEYEPISYTLENMLPSGKLYFLTARRSTGKTAFLMTAMFAIAFNRPDIIGTGVTPGHTAYIAFENPTDIRMKIAVYAHHFGISKQELNEKITIIDARMSTEDVFDQLTDAAEEKGKFQLVLYDTFQAGFDGDEFNNNSQVLSFTRGLRTLCELLGEPYLIELPPIQQRTPEKPP